MERQEMTDNQDFEELRLVAERIASGIDSYNPLEDEDELNCPEDPEASLGSEGNPEYEIRVVDPATGTIYTLTLRLGE
jgi:hypothetical protein